MSRHATFTEAELRRAIRVGAEFGKTVHLVRNDETTKLVFKSDDPDTHPADDFDLVDTKK